MDTSGIVNVAVTVAVLALVLRRQLSARPLRDTSRLGLVLIAVGVVETASFVSRQQVSGRSAGLLAASGAVGLLLAAARAFTIRLWRQEGQSYRQGTAVTAVLWIVAIALHTVMDALVKRGLGSATVLLYLGVVLLAQQQILLARARAAGLASSPGPARLK